jgi:hypothetical protein
VNTFGARHSDILSESVAPRWVKRLTASTGSAKKKHDFDPRKFVIV